MKRKNKKIVVRETAESLLTLVRMGKARVVREYIGGEPELSIVSASGVFIGVPSERYRNMFEAALLEQGSGDGLFEGFDQTTK